MRKLIGMCLLVLTAFTLGAPARAGERGTAAEAVALVGKAADALKANGKDQLFSEVNKPSGKFVKGDLYVFIHDLNGNCLAHGGNPKLIGKNLLEMQDANGYKMVRGFVDTAISKGKGWVNYKWLNKTTKEVEDKSTYLEKHGDLIISVGIYKA